MIRYATVKDAMFIQEILDKSLGYKVDLKRVVEQIDDINHNSQQEVLVYEDEENQRVVGFLDFYLYRSLYMGTGFRLSTLAAHPDYQGKGIGGKLVKEVEEIANKQNLDFIILNSGVEKEAAHRFYEKKGYEYEKTQKRFIKSLK